MATQPTDDNQREVRIDHADMDKAIEAAKNMIDDAALGRSLQANAAKRAGTQYAPTQDMQYVTMSVGGSGDVIAPNAPKEKPEEKPFSMYGPVDPKLAVSPTGKLTDIKPVESEESEPEEALINHDNDPDNNKSKKKVSASGVDEDSEGTRQKLLHGAIASVTEKGLSDEERTAAYNTAFMTLNIEHGSKEDLKISSAYLKSLTPEGRDYITGVWSGALKPESDKPSGWENDDALDKAIGADHSFGVREQHSKGSHVSGGASMTPAHNAMFGDNDSQAAMGIPASVAPPRPNDPTVLIIQH